MGFFQRAGRVGVTILWCMVLCVGLTGARAPAPPDVPRVIDETKVPGAWRLVHTEMRMPDGTTFPNPSYGSNPRGYLIYDKSHTMCVYLAPSDEPSRAPPGFMRQGRSAAPPQGPSAQPQGSNAEQQGPSAQRQAPSAQQRGANYCGRWRLNESRTAIIHQVEIAFEKMLIGDQVRKAWIDGDTLTIRSPLPQGLQDYYLQFERVQ